MPILVHTYNLKCQKLQYNVFVLYILFYFHFYTQGYVKSKANSCMKHLQCHEKISTIDKLTDNEKTRRNCNKIQHQPIIIQIIIITGKSNDRKCANFNINSTREKSQSSDFSFRFIQIVKLSQKRSEQKLQQLKQLNYVQYAQYKYPSSVSSSVSK